MAEEFGLEFGRVGDLPENAVALLGQDAFSTVGWYRSVERAALPEGATLCFQVIEGQAVSPMLRRGRRLDACTTPYTCFWQPLFSAAADPELVGREFGRRWRAGAPVRLDCMAGGDARIEAFLRGLRAGGLRALPFDHFGNWHVRVGGMNWGMYVASRPGQLRSALTRQTRRLMKMPGAAFDLVQGGAGLEAALAAYEKVYDASWKEAEPFPLFNAMFMRECAADRSLRLGILRLAGRPVAAQFWLVRDGVGMVLKLAYDEACKQLAPGNVLSGLVIRHLLEQDGVEELDFGRGDDGYKELWTGERRQRVGVVVVNPASVSGLARMLARGRPSFLKQRSKRPLFVRA